MVHPVIIFTRFEKQLSRKIFRVWNDSGSGQDKGGVTTQVGRVQGSGFRKEAVAEAKIAACPILTCRRKSKSMAPVLVDP
jgi:hypothetical protein